MGAFVCHVDSSSAGSKADPSTLTGSIGIFYGKADVAGLLSHLHVGVELSRRGERADMDSMYRPYTPEERQYSQACQVVIVQGDQSKRHEYQNARSLFRMKSERLQEGWVRIDFQPEIHHGEHRVRHTPTDEGWAYRSRQNVDAKHAHQFSLTMNVGEVAIITAAPDQPESMGQFFFCRDDNGIPKQRVLIVRVADAGSK